MPAGVLDFETCGHKLVYEFLKLSTENYLRVSFDRKAFVELLSLVRGIIDHLDVTEAIDELVEPMVSGNVDLLVVPE
jgi:hypothetical protein